MIRIKIKKLNKVLHRDVGYFFSGLIIIYCLSGLALNHIDDWNPDFIIQKKIIEFPMSYRKDEIDQERIFLFNTMVGEKDYRIYDFPTVDQLKIYYDNASLHINLSKKIGSYEKIVRRPIIYHTNILHRNNLSGWKWFSDIFAIMLILINITGLFIFKEKYGIIGRGKWFLAAGIVPPVIAIIIFSLA